MYITSRVDLLSWLYLLGTKHCIYLAPCGSFYCCARRRKHTRAPSTLCYMEAGLFCSLHLYVHCDVVLLLFTTTIHYSDYCSYISIPFCWPSSTTTSHRDLYHPSSLSLFSLPLSPSGAAAPI